MKVIPKAGFPVFPLLGTILIPDQELPLHVFEPRYRQMVSDAISEEGYIGVIQPRNKEGFEPPLYEVGTLGKIASSEELPDGRYLIVLKGVCRFRVVRELPKKGKLYRRVQAEYLEEDVSETPALEPIRNNMLQYLAEIVSLSPFQIDLQVLREKSPGMCIQELSQVLQFRPVERQMLLEAETLLERAQRLESLLRMSLAQVQDTGSPQKKVLH